MTTKGIAQHCKSKAVKVTAGILGGGSLLTGLIWPLFTYQASVVDAKIFTVNDKIKVQERILREYVDLNNQNLETKINNLSNGQVDIKKLLEITNKRLYELKNNN